MRQPCPGHTALEHCVIEDCLLMPATYNLFHDEFIKFWMSLERQNRSRLKEALNPAAGAASEVDRAFRYL